MDETHDPKPHPHALCSADAVNQTAQKNQRKELSIWFFCGVLMLSYGLLLTGTGIYEHFGHQPNTVLAAMESTLWWGVFLTLFGGFFTAKWRP